jgi:hypothetical protein
MVHVLPGFSSRTLSILEALGSKTFWTILMRRRVFAKVY